MRRRPTNGRALPMREGIGPMRDESRIHNIPHPQCVVHVRGFLWVRDLSRTP